MDLKGKKINFLGDSITEGSGASCKENCYVSLIEKDTGAICRNYGIGGTRIARQQTPSNPIHDQYYGSRVENMDPDADIVVVFGGTNDFGHGDASLGMFDDRTVDTFYGALHLLYTSLIEKYSDSKIIVITPLHRCAEDNLRGDGSKSRDYATLKAYVDMIRKVAEYYSLPVLDLYKESGIQPKIPVIQEKYMPDGLHPNDAGYRILADKIIKYLESL